MRKIIYLICVFVSVFILSGCGSKSITIKFGGDTETVVESKVESGTEEESAKLEESNIAEKVCCSGNGSRGCTFRIFAGDSASNCSCYSGTGFDNSLCSEL